MFTVFAASLSLYDVFLVIVSGGGGKNGSTIAVSEYQAMGEDCCYIVFINTSPPPLYIWVFLNLEKDQILLVKVSRCKPFVAY